MKDNNKPNVFLTSDGQYVYQTSPEDEERVLTPTAISQSMFDNPKYWSFTDVQGRKYTPKKYPQKENILVEGKSYVPVVNDIKKYFNELSYRLKEDPSSIALQGKYVMPLILSPILAKGAATTLTNPYGDALLTSAFGAHGLQNITNGTANWETALEITPLGRVFKPIYNTTINLSKPIINKSKWLYNKGNIFNTSMKYNPNNFYREVSKEAIDDAVKSGVVRTGNSDKYIGPFFAKGSTPWRREKYIIEGYPEKNNWIYANPYENAFWVGKEDPLAGKTLMQQALNKKVSNNTIVGAEVFPYTNGSINATPTSNFSYWKKYPLLGWRKKSFKSTNTTPQITAENIVSLIPESREGTKEILWVGSNLKPYISTSLKFFERKPSRISFAERVGVPKGERNLPFKPKLPIEHVQGDEAIKMFKEYGGTPIPEGSINGEQLRKYVAEARERYGLVGNNNVTDEEIALALYKHSKELGGNTAAVNALGEPLLLFRGDTQRYTQLKKRISPEELATKSGTMDNSLGNLFLGEFPDSYRGVDRYIGTWRNFNGNPKLIGSGTGSKVVWDGKTASEIEGYPYLGPLAGGGYKLYSQPHRYGYIDVYKLPASMMESGVNDLNAFIVRTPLMRNASSEISVLNDDWMLQGARGSHFMSKNYKYNPKTSAMENVKTGESLGEITTESAPESRVAMGDHYKELLKEAEQKQLGLLKSEANTPLRDEHSQYSYFALPNFNIRGAKHLLPYDLRIPRNWKDRNIYRGLIPIAGGYTLYNMFNQPQLQYLRQGGKMNTLLFLKNGSGIHIKKKNRGKFTDYCGGLVTQECINKGKHSSNPAIRKRAVFAENARRWAKKGELGMMMPVPSPYKDFIDKNYNSHYIDNKGLLKNRIYNWDTFDKMYKEGKSRKIPYNTLIALMSNVAVESGGYEDQRLIDWNHKKGTPWRYLPNGGQGLLQYNIVPKNLRLAIYDSVMTPHNSETNYWKGRDTHRSRLSRGEYNLKDSIKHYRLNYVRPGAPALEKTYIIGDYLSKIYPRYYQQGGNIGNIFSNIGKFLKSDTGQSVIGLGKSLIGGIKDFKQQNKLYNSQVADIENNYNLILNNVGDYSNEAMSELNQLKSLNKDNNYSSIDYYRIKNRYNTQAYNQAKQLADSYKSMALSNINKPTLNLSGFSESLLNLGNSIFKNNNIKTPTRKEIDLKFSSNYNQVMKDVNKKLTI